jgi:hypothetical protein
MKKKMVSSETGIIIGVCAVVAAGFVWMVWGTKYVFDNPDKFTDSKSEAVLGEDKQKEAALKPLKRPEGLNP